MNTAVETPAVYLFPGNRCALVVREEFAGIFDAVVCDNPIKTMTFTAEELREAKPAMLNGEPYPPDKLALRWGSGQGLSKLLGVSDAARELLSIALTAANTMKGKKMSIEQAVLALAAAIEKVAAVMTGDEQPEAGAAPPAPGEAPKRGRGRPAKAPEAPAAQVGGLIPGAAMPAASAGGLTPSAGPVPGAGLGFAATAPQQPPVSLPGATYAQVQQALVNLDQQKGREVCVALLARYGAQKLPEVSPLQFGSMLAEINATLAGGHDPAAAQQTAGGMFG